MVKKFLTMMVVASLLASPGLAWAGPDDPVEKPKLDLRAAAKAVAKEIVAEEAEAEALAPATAPQNGIAQDKFWAGVGLLALGAGIIYKGVDLHTSEEDPFGRTKNADAFLAIGVGSVFAAFGALAVKGGLAGNGF